MKKKFNKGEWSELYATLKILSSNRIKGCRNFGLKYTFGNTDVYYVKEEDSDVIKMIVDGKVKKLFSILEIVILLKDFYKTLIETKASSFTMPNKIENLIDDLELWGFKAPSQTKRDLTLFTFDNNEYKEYGCSVKSQLGQAYDIQSGSGKNLMAEVEISNISSFDANIAEQKFGTKILTKFAFLYNQNQSYYKFNRFYNEDFNNSLEKISAHYGYEKNFLQQVLLLCLEYYINAKCAGKKGKYTYANALESLKENNPLYIDNINDYEDILNHYFIECQTHLNGVYWNKDEKEDVTQFLTVLKDGSIDIKDLSEYKEDLSKVKFDRSSASRGDKRIPIKMGVITPMENKFFLYYPMQIRHA